MQGLAVTHGRGFLISSNEQAPSIGCPRAFAEFADAKGTHPLGYVPRMLRCAYLAAENEILFLLQFRRILADGRQAVHLGTVR